MQHLVLYMSDCGHTCMMQQMMANLDRVRRAYTLNPCRMSYFCGFPWHPGHQGGPRSNSRYQLLTARWLLSWVGWNVQQCHVIWLTDEFVLHFGARMCCHRTDLCMYAAQPHHVRCFNCFAALRSRKQLGGKVCGVAGNRVWYLISRDSCHIMCGDMSILGVMPCSHAGMQ